MSETSDTTGPEVTCQAPVIVTAIHQVPAATLSPGDFFRNYGRGYQGRYIDDLVFAADGSVIFTSHRCADIVATHGAEIWTMPPGTPVWIDGPGEYDRRCPCGWVVRVPAWHIDRHGGPA